MDVRTPRMESNKDNPIVINSDEEDYIFSAVKEQPPSVDEFDLSKGPAKELTETSSKQKVFPYKALDILLKGIPRSKLSINKAYRLKCRELKIRNMKLLEELAAVKKLQQVDERLLSCKLGLIQGCKIDSPPASAGRSFLARTSIASTPMVHQTEVGPAQNPPRHATEDFITGTQELILLQSGGGTVTATPATLKGLEEGLSMFMHLKSKSKKESRYHNKNKLNGYISDEESSSPKLTNFMQHQPKHKICISKLITQDIDEVTSSLKG